VAQRLAKQGVRIEEYPQTVPNLTAATSNLFDLISARQLILYPDAAMRLAVSRASTSSSLNHLITLASSGFKAIALANAASDSEVL
jgi:hypothetical protein